MVHVVFSTSEKGSLRVALSGPGGAAAVAVIGGTGGPLERLAAKREAARQRQRAAEALLMEGTPADVVCLPLALSVGDISEAEPGEKRKKELAGLWAMSPAENEEFAEKMLEEKVNLKLWVKVKKDWRDSDFLIKNFGYDKKEV